MANVRTFFELLGTTDGVTTRTLQNIAKDNDSARAAFEKLRGEAAKVPPTLRLVNAAASEARASLQAAAASTGPFGSSLAALGGTAGIAAAGAIGLSAAFVGLTKRAFDAAGALVDAADATG